MRGSQMSGAPVGNPRFGEISKLLPVTMVISIIVILYTEYVFLHCLRLLQLDLPYEQRKKAEAHRGIVELWIFHIFTALMLYCFGKCILTHPGTIPDNLGWDLVEPSEEDSNARSEPREKKHTGERRHCKWCLKYKPDRCHHCRICSICVLRMDHHCPWVYNCIGFRNHKHFFLLLVYVVVDLLFINFTMFDSVWWATRTDVSLVMMLALTFGETLATFLAVLTFCFLLFHVWLMSRAMTTVEFCEKSLKKSSYNSSAYSLGLYQNICMVLGSRPVLWLFPVSLPKGDGLMWDGNDRTPLVSRRKSSCASELPSAISNSAASAAPAANAAEQLAAETAALAPAPKVPAPEPLEPQIAG